MKKMILLFSHQLTDEQIKDAKENWNVENFLALSSELQNYWSNIDPELGSLKNELLLFCDFIDEVASKGDLILIQGDFGACCFMAHYAKSKYMIPVYATTKRSVKEYTEDGKNIKKSIFEHRKFRRYE